MKGNIKNISSALIPKLILVVAVFQSVFISILYWIIFALGVLFTFLVYLLRKRNKLRTLLEEGGVKHYTRNYYGIFVSRFELNSEASINRLGVFIIPKKNETSEQVLLRYLPLLRGLECDVFAFNRPKISKKLSKRKAIRNYYRLLNAYQLFLIKTSYLNRIVLIADINVAHIALLLAMQVPTAGLILDATKRRRKYKRWSKLFDKIEPFSFVNLWVNIVSKTERENTHYSTQERDPIPPVMLVSIKEPKIKRIFRTRYCSLKLLREKITRAALRIKTVEHDEEFKSSIQMFVENLANRNYLLHN